MRITVWAKIARTIINKISAIEDPVIYTVHKKTMHDVDINSTPDNSIVDNEEIDNGVETNKWLPDVFLFIDRNT